MGEPLILDGVDVISVAIGNGLLLLIGVVAIIHLLPLGILVHVGPLRLHTAVLMHDRLLVGALFRKNLTLGSLVLLQLMRTFGLGLEGLQVGHALALVPSYEVHLLLAGHRHPLLLKLWSQHGYLALIILSTN